ncbi:hypothetical protein HanOQP8_Chr12g0439811 [Helianthus annuus]|nr:hypothetical protein HanOQP8_Chr12g0439811 [Helianthus annuus]
MAPSPVCRPRPGSSHTAPSRPVPDRPTPPPPGRWRRATPSSLLV